MTDQNIERIKKQIKKNNGEKFLHALQRYSDLFQIPNIVEIVKYAGREPKEILPFLLTLLPERPEPVPGVSTDWRELLSLAGYNAYYANTLKKQNAIQKYFISGEELCTFKDEKRFKEYYIVNAIKKGIDKVKRVSFYGKEKRQDDYGTSVISIQIPKTGGYVFITNRYNHSVEDPDSTFCANPDEIIPGLNFALQKAFHVDFNMGATCLPSHYRMDEDGRIFKFLFEQNGMYFSNTAWMDYRQIHPIDPDSQVLLGHVILDVQQKAFASPLGRSSGILGVGMTEEGRLVRQLNRAFRKVKRFAITTDKEAGTKSIWAVNKGDKQEIIKIKADGSEILELNFPGKSLPAPFGVPVRRINAPCLKTIDGELASTVRELNAPDGLIIDGCVDLGDQGLLKLPDFSRYIVKGSFFCDSNFLVDLVGAPKEVTELFDISRNAWLESLHGSPVKVGDLEARMNGRLRSLEGGPRFVTNYVDCTSCGLETLLGAPEKIGGNFYCDDNYLENLLYGPKYVGRTMTCSGNNLTSFIGAPEFIGGDFIATRNPLTPAGMQEGLPKKLGGELLCKPCSRNFRTKRALSENALLDFSRAVYNQKNAFPEKRVRTVIKEYTRHPLSVRGKTCIKVLEKRLAAHMDRGRQKEHD